MFPSLSCLRDGFCVRRGSGKEEKVCPLRRGTCHSSLVRKRSTKNIKSNKAQEASERPPKRRKKAAVEDSTPAVQQAQEEIVHGLERYREAQEM